MPQLRHQRGWKRRTRRLRRAVRRRQHRHRGRAWRQRVHRGVLGLHAQRRYRTQQGSKLVGTGAAGPAAQGRSVSLSGDGNTAIVGGHHDNNNTGAAWVFVQSAGTLQVSPTTNIVASGAQGEAFSPASFQYQLTSTIGSVNYLISGIPTWLNANFTSGTATTTPVTLAFTLINPSSLSPGTYTMTISFTNTSNGQGNTTRTATLTVNAGTKDGCKDGGWKITSRSLVPLRTKVNA